jgi:hypothetical protein
VRAHAELGHVGLADRQHARIAQTLDEHGVLRRHVVLEYRGAASEREPDRGFRVFERKRQTVQRANVVASRDASIGFVRERETLDVIELGHDRVDPRIHTLDLSQVSQHDVARGELAGANEADQFLRAHEAQSVGTLQTCGCRDRRRNGRVGAAAGKHVCRGCRADHLQELTSAGAHFTPPASRQGAPAQAAHQSESLGVILVESSPESTYWPSSTPACRQANTCARAGRFLASSPAHRASPTYAPKSTWLNNGLPARR